jgi:hypothetical protein
MESVLWHEARLGSRSCFYTTGGDAYLLRDALAERLCRSCGRLWRHCEAVAQTVVAPRLLFCFFFFGWLCVSTQARHPAGLAASATA